MKRLIAPLVSILIMGIIFWRIDLRDLAHQVSVMNLPLLFLAVLFFIPQILITAYRWKEMISSKVQIRLLESTKLILAGNALNILLPSRMGDLSKAYFLKREGKLEIKRGTNIVLFEKYMDLASLGIVILAGVLFDFEWNQPTFIGICYSLGMIGIFPVLYFVRLDKRLQKPWVERSRILSKIRNFLVDSQEYLQELKQKPKHLTWLILLSISLWFAHLLQFHVFFRALHSQISLFHILRLVPLAMLFGLIPITMAGIGTRDSAMIYLLSPHESVSKIVGVGIFASLRYFVPGILGLPFLNQYIARDLDDQGSRSQTNTGASLAE